MSVLINERPANIPLQSACYALGLNRSSVYARRRRASKPDPSRVSRKTAPQPRALAPEERQRVHDVLTSAEFCNQPPVEVYHTLLERGVYLCSVSTMHRILREYAENDEALWMLRVSSIKGELLGLRYATVTPGEHLLRGVAGEPGVMMVEVVPVEV